MGRGFAHQTDFEKKGKNIYIYIQTVFLFLLCALQVSVFGKGHVIRTCLFLFVMGCGGGGKQSSIDCLSVFCNQKIIFYFFLFLSVV